MSDLPMPFSIFEYLQRTHTYRYLQVDTTRHGAHYSTTKYGWSLNIGIKNHEGEYIKSYAYSLSFGLQIRESGTIRNATESDEAELIRFIDEYSLEKDVIITTHVQTPSSGHRGRVGIFIDNQGKTHEIHPADPGHGVSYNITNVIQIILKEPSPTGAKKDDTGATDKISISGITTEYHRILNEFIPQFDDISKHNEMILIEQLINVIIQMTKTNSILPDDDAVLTNFLETTTDVLDTIETKNYRGFARKTRKNKKKCKQRKNTKRNRHK